MSLFKTQSVHPLLDINSAVNAVVYIWVPP